MADNQMEDRSRTAPLTAIQPSFPPPQKKRKAANLPLVCALFWPEDFWPRQMTFSRKFFRASLQRRNNVGFVHLGLRAETCCRFRMDWQHLRRARKVACNIILCTALLNRKSQSSTYDNFFLI